MSQGGRWGDAFPFLFKNRLKSSTEDTKDTVKQAEVALNETKIASVNGRRMAKEIGGSSKSKKSR